VVGGFCETGSKRFDGVEAAMRCDAMRRDVPTAAGTGYAEMTNRGTWRGARALVGARFGSYAAAVDSTVVLRLLAIQEFGQRGMVFPE
jgi:hypothetical protein